MVGATRTNLLAVTAFAGLLAAGCAGTNGSPGSNGPGMPPGVGSLPGAGPLGLKTGVGSDTGSGSSSAYIQHVVIVLQENRSFDDFFATFPGAVGATYGCMKSGGPAARGRRPSGSQCPSGDTVVPLTEAGLDSNSLGHERFSFIKEYDNGRMDGFNEVERALRKGEKVPAGTYPYRYVDPKYIAPYWQIAQDWVLADHMFSTQGSSSFTAHQDFIAGGTPIGNDNVIDFPSPSNWGCTAPPGTVTSLVTQSGNYLRDKGPYPCFSYSTIRDLLDAKGISWLYFTNPSRSYVWDAFDAINAVRNGPEWTSNIIVPETDIFQYVSNAQLPGVTYVIPDAGTSDHPGPAHDNGPDWVASVVNAIGESAYWPSTVIIVVWDEWGGEYDNVPPPQLDGQGLGPRIPMLIVSAYDKETTPSQPGYISHTQYEDGSVLKFIEQNWGLGSLGTSDVRANSIIDSFDFTQAPRPFIPISYSQHPMSYFAHHYIPSREPIDEY